MDTDKEEKIISEIRIELIKYCLVMAENKTVAEDLAHDTLLEYLRDYPNRKINRSSERLLFKIARNNCLNYIKRRGLVKYEGYDENYLVPS